MGGRASFKAASISSVKMQAFTRRSEHSKDIRQFAALQNTISTGKAC